MSNEIRYNGQAIDNIRSQMAKDKERFTDLNQDRTALAEYEAMMSVDNLALLEHSASGGSERIPQLDVPVTSDKLASLFVQNPHLVTTPIGILKHPLPFDPHLRTAHFDRINALRSKRNTELSAGDTMLFRRATFSSQQRTYYDELLEEKRLRLGFGPINESGTISGLSFSVLDRKTGEEHDASRIYLAYLEVRSAFTEILMPPRIENNRIVLDIRPQQSNNTLHAA